MKRNTEIQTDKKQSYLETEKHSGEETTIIRLNKIEDKIKWIKQIDVIILEKTKKNKCKRTKDKKFEKKLKRALTKYKISFFYDA